MNSFATLKSWAVHLEKPALIILLLLALVASFWLYTLSRTQSHDLLTDPRFLTSWIDDRSLRGRSRASLYREEDVLVLECQLQASSYQWPFCGLRMNWDSRSHGIGFLDISDFDFLRVRLNYRELPEANGSIRLHLIAELPMSAGGLLKHQELTLPAQHQRQSLALDSFEVPLWWQREHQHLSAEQRALQLNGIRRIQIYTGLDLAMGTYHLEVRELSLIKQPRLQPWQAVLLFFSLWLLMGAWLFKRTTRASSSEPDWESLNQFIKANTQTTIIMLSPNHDKPASYKAWLPTKHLLQESPLGLILLLAEQSIEQAELIARTILEHEPSLCIGISGYATNEQAMMGYHRASQALNAAMSLGPAQIMIAHQT